MGTILIQTLIIYLASVGVCYTPDALTAYSMGRCESMATALALPIEEAPLGLCVLRVETDGEAYRCLGARGVLRYGWCELRWQ